MRPRGLIGERLRKYKTLTDKGGDPMARVMADCRRFESDSNCSLTMLGAEEEVVHAAAAHAAAVHGHPDTPELREQLRGMLEPATRYGEARIPEPFPA